MKTLGTLTLLVLVLAGLNWGLVALANYDLIASLFGMHFGEVSMPSRIVYGLVGAAAIYQVLIAETFQKLLGSKPA
jgi:uncharacterized membrane protein YuzA (DUF378 family)